MATKTSKRIERDIFRMLKDSDLSSAIGGKFYRDGMRPIDSKNEDAVVKFLTGVDGQEQNGVVLLHVYVTDKDFYRNGALCEDIGRVEQLEEEITDVIAAIDRNEYIIKTDGTPQSYKSQDYNGQHFINVRITYRRSIYNE